MINESIRQRVLARLITDFKFHTSDDGSWLNQGVCPKCQKKELYISTNNPTLIKCGRENKCAYTNLIKELYPDEFGNFNQRYKSSKENPRAVATAYLSEARQLNTTRFADDYNQGEFSYNAGNTKKTTATVLFNLANQTIFHRFVETIYVVGQDGSVKKRKQHLNGTYKGSYFAPQNQKITAGDTVWITEAVLDTLSLVQSGLKSIAILSCNNYPADFINMYKTKGIKYVVALDNDCAGKKATKTIVEKLENDNQEVTAAQCPANIKKDWNDLLIAGRLGKTDLENYLYHGALLIAKSVSEKAELINSKTSARQFVVDYNNQMYWCDFNTESDDNKLAVKKIANARPEFLYFQRNPLTDESLFYAKVHFPDNRPAVGVTFSPSQLSSATDFKKRFASAQGAFFTGTTKHLDWMFSRSLTRLNAIETMDYMGYNPDYQAYIFNDVCVYNKNIINLNKDDYFELDNKKSIKSIYRNLGLQIKSNSNDYTNDWVDLLYKAYGYKGLTACVFWFASLFAVQIRDKQSSFPFLEIIGEPGSGKTTLVEFLWKLFGRNEEGTDPNKNTFAGNQRKLNQYSNQPIVFIEADRDVSTFKRFDWEEVKPYYNGRGLRARGLKNSGNETYEPPFRATLVIEQNNAIVASDAVLERIIQLSFDKKTHNSDTKLAADKLNALSISDVSYFIVKACLAEAEIVSHVNAVTAKYQQQLLQDNNINHARLALNHAQLIAFADKFCQLVGLNKQIATGLASYIKDLCIAREACLDGDVQIVQDFWDSYEYLDSQELGFGDSKVQLNHSSDERYVAINLNEFIEHAAYRRQQVAQLSELKKLLKTSKRYKFIESSKAIKSPHVTSAIGAQKTIRCWVFKKPDDCIVQKSMDYNNKKQEDEECPF